MLKALVEGEYLCSPKESDVSVQPTGNVEQMESRWTILRMGKSTGWPIQGCGTDLTMTEALPKHDKTRINGCTFYSKRSTTDTHTKQCPGLQQRPSGFLKHSIVLIWEGKKKHLAHKWKLKETVSYKWKPDMGTYNCHACSENTGRRNFSSVRKLGLKHIAIVS